MGQVGEPRELTDREKAQMRALGIWRDEPKRVIPIGQVRAWGQRHLLLDVLVTYEEGSRLLYHMFGPDLEGSNPHSLPWYLDKFPDMRGEDDAGIEYLLFKSSGGGGGGGLWHGEMRMTPALSEHATRLSVFARLPLTSTPEPSFSGSATRFDITL
jgi:hypothetical protein